MKEPSEGETEKVMPDTGDWRSCLLESEAARSALLSSVRRVAIIGIKTPEAGGPAFDVPAVMQRAGYDIIPVPVYYPEVTHILGVPVHRTLTTVVPPPDMVVLFRRPIDVAGHLDELLAVRPRAVWMQQGIRHEAVAEALAKAGILVVQDACVKIDLALMGR
jgi:predicted CoA-binding protein